MPFLLIRGLFLPKTGTPDGDSVRFTPDDPALFRQLETDAGRKLKSSTNATGRESVQLRYEGIDAMEKDAGGTLPTDAKDKNLALTGLTSTVSEPPGYILASGIEKNGRPIVFAFAGTPTDPDGTSVFLKGPLLRKSINYQLMKAGMVYPMLYMSLYAELRNELTTAWTAAVTAGLGVAAADQSRAGFVFKSGSQVNQLPPIFPKLYRRLQKSSATTASDFIAKLAEKPERVATLSDGRFIDFHDTLTAVGATKLKMLYSADDLVFDET